MEGEVRKPIGSILLHPLVAAAILAACPVPGSAPLAQSAAETSTQPSARRPAQTSATFSAEEAAVLALDQRIADAVVRGDTAYVDSVTASDFVMVHGDGWTRGEPPLLIDTKASLLNRVANGYYDVIDFDSVEAEMHDDVAITHGRYIAHVTDGDPDRAWFAVWFERVYAQRADRWMYLSHRTVHGPVFGPDRASASRRAESLPGRGPAMQVTASDGQAAGVELLALERRLGEAIVRGDTAYFDRVTASDFVMIHGDGWTHGEPPALVDDKASFMQRVANRLYAAHDYEAQAVEMHGDVAITYGRYVGHIPGSPPGRRWFYVWYQKVYAKRDGAWVYLSHRTVDGAHYALDRTSLGGQ
jgi:hypothetical protein